MSSSFSNSASATVAPHHFNVYHQQQKQQQQQQQQQSIPAAASAITATQTQQHYQQQMRRVSLPNALQNQPQQSNGNGGGNRSPRSRTPNSLSPKLGFLKEISEFDIDPPFISPAASSSSSADNSNCTSPMLLSPSAQRPASARLYRRNRNSQPSVYSSIASNGATVSTAVVGTNSRESPRQRKSSKSTMINGNEPPEDDGFRWTDVDGFYGRKNSIPLQQLLANDMALLNGLELAKKKNAGTNPHGNNSNGNSCSGTPTKKMSAEGSPPKMMTHFLNVEPENNELNISNNGNINIPSDITEDEDEDRAAEQKQHNNNSMEVPCRERSASHNVRLHEVKKSSSAPMSSPTKRRLMMLSNRLYSLENKHKVEEEEGEEMGDDTETTPEEQEATTDNEAGQQQKGHGMVDSPTAGGGGGKVKFMESVEEMERHKAATTTTTNGIVDNDIQVMRRTLKARKQRPITQQFRHFSIDSQGDRVVDSGVRTIRAKLHPGQQQQQLLPATNAATKSTRNQKARRATCPEIWLSIAEDEQRPLVECAVRLFGCTSVGKKCVAKQIASAAEVAPVEDDIVSIDSEDMQRPYRTVSFLLNEHEVHMEIIQGSLLPESRRGTAAATGELTIFAVVYSVENRESFIRAAQILYRLYGDRHGTKREQKAAKQKAIDRASVPLILIANKSDLQRKRRVTSIEGKMLAKIYKCPFVEMSALLSANVETLWREVLRKLFKYLQTRERLLQQSQENMPDTSNSSPRLMARPPLVGRFLERTRRFAKSCEDWIAARIVAI